MWIESTIESICTCFGEEFVQGVHAAVGVHFGRSSTIETIQVVLDKKLLDATNRAAKRTKQNRSALIRDALQGHLRRLQIQALEERDRSGYLKKPAAVTQSVSWEVEAAWPDK